MSNQEQIEYWSGQTGQTWVQTQDEIDTMMTPITRALLQHIGPVDGKRVLDIGCGCGTSSLALARAGARVTGVDVSGPMLNEASRRAAAANLIETTRFIEADAASADLDAPFDLAVSRFGVMFFSDPTVAFAHIRSQLKERAPLRFVCWAGMQDNDWFFLAARALKPFMPPPETAPDPRAPGPFAFADPAYVKSLLGDAGFSDIELTSLRVDLRLGAELEAAVGFQSRIGPLSRAMGSLQGTQRDAAVAAVREALAPQVKGDGVSVPGQCWLVSASA